MDLRVSGRMVADALAKSCGGEASRQADACDRMTLSSSSSSQEHGCCYEEEEEERKRKASSSSGGAQLMSDACAAATKLQAEADARRCRSRVARLVNSPAFDAVFLVLIISNSLFIGIQVEYAAYMGTATPMGFVVVQYGYCVIFMIELGLRICASGPYYFCNKDWAWNYLDLFVVVMSTLEALLQLINTAENTQLSLFRLVRVVRSLRVLRIIRIVRFFRNLRMMINSIVSTLRSLVWALSLMCLVMYVFGVVFTQAATQHITDHGGPRELLDYYGTLPRSAFTLFKAMCNGVSWGEVVAPLSQVHWIYVAMFLTFISFIYFCVLNVVTGTFCQSAIESAEHDQDMVISEKLRMKQHYVDRLKRLFLDLDSLHVGTITLEDFERNLEDEHVKAYFAALELDISDAWTLFKLLDTDGTNGIDLDEFVEGCMRLRGSATSIDIAKMMYETRWMMNKLSNFMGHMDDVFAVMVEKEKENSGGMKNWRAPPKVSL